MLQDASKLWRIRLAFWLGTVLSGCPTASLPPIMRNEGHANEGKTPASAQVDGATLEFRPGPDAVTLDLAYEVPGMAMSMADKRLDHGIAVLCETEIAEFRTALRAVGGALASQLGEAGQAPDLTLQTSDDDHRECSDRGTEFLVRPSRFHSESVPRRD